MKISDSAKQAEVIIRNYIKTPYPYNKGRVRRIIQQAIETSTKEALNEIDQLREVLHNIEIEDRIGRANGLAHRALSKKTN